jgi:hypothetical protein
MINYQLIIIIFHLILILQHGSEMQMHVAKELMSPSFFKEDQSISMVMHREGDSVGDSYNPDSIFNPTGLNDNIILISIFILLIITLF